MIKNFLFACAKTKPYLISRSAGSAITVSNLIKLQCFSGLRITNTDAEIDSGFASEIDLSAGAGNDNCTNPVTCTNTNNKDVHKKKNYVANFKIKYKLPEGHQGLLDTSTKLETPAKYMDRVKDRVRRGLKHKENIYQRIIEKEPQVLEMSKKVEKNPFAKMISSGLRECFYTRISCPRDFMLRIRKACKEYPDPSKNNKGRYVIVVDETRQTTRYRGKSTHLFCNANVILNFIIDNIPYIQRNLGEIRSDFIGYTEKILKIRVLTEAVSLLLLNEETADSPKFKLVDMYTQSELGSLRSSAFSDYALILKFNSLDLDFESATSELNPEFLSRNIIKPGALDSQLIEKIYKELPSVQLDLNSALKGLSKKGKYKQIASIYDFIEKKEIPDSFDPLTGNSDLLHQLIKHAHIYDGNYIFGTQTPAAVFLKTILLLSPINAPKLQSWLENSRTTNSKMGGCNPLYICIHQDKRTTALATQLYKHKIYL